MVLYTPKEVADILKVDTETLYSWRRVKDKGPRWIKLEGAIRYREEDLEAYLTRQSENSSSTVPE